MYERGSREFVSQAFDWAVEAFEGRYRDYQAIDARYHDLEHTLQGTLCYAQILQGRQRARATPALPDDRPQTMGAGRTAGRSAALQAFFVANAGRSLLPGHEASGALTPPLKDEEA